MPVRAAAAATAAHASAPAADHASAPSAHDLVQ
jgi:hypothetical protein